MGKRIVGVTSRKRRIGKVYELYSYQDNKRIALGTVKAKNKTHAFEIREERLLRHKKESKEQSLNKDYLNASFEEGWTILERKLWELDPKTINGIKNCYKRMFLKFAPTKCSDTKTFSDINVNFFLEYKRYFWNEIENPKEGTRGRPGGWRSEIIRVKNILSKLKDAGCCPKSLLEEVRKHKDLKTPMAKSPEYEDIAKEKFNKIFAYMKQDRSDYYDLTFLQYWTGRRISECTLLEKGDVMSGGYKQGNMPLEIKVRKEICKGNKNSPDPISIPLEWNPELQRHIKEMLKKKGKWLFPNRYGRRCTPNRIRDYLRKVSVKIIGRKVTPHDFRRNLVTVLKRDGMGDKDIMAITGHHDANVLNRHYSFSTPTGRKRAYGVLSLKSNNR